MGPYSRISGYRCPHCRALLQAHPMQQTRPIRGSWRAIEDHYTCHGCETKLRMAKKGHWLVSVLQVFVFLVTALLSSALVTKIPLLSASNGAQTGPNFLGFLCVLLGVVLPATAFFNRLRSIEVVQ